MNEFYGPAQRALQDDFDTRRLADTLQAAIITEEIDDDRKSFIESRDFFFLSTVGADGWPTVSYKGGPVGMVQVEDPRTIVFPSYDGNGMFLSMGNVDTHGGEGAKIGMLFVDFETPNRLRLHATARVHRDDPAMDRFPGADLIVRARVENSFVNCARYVHPHTRVASSEYVPDADGAQPYPAWKRMDLIQPVLSDRDQGRAAAAGGEIDVEEYARRLADGTS
ncbi:pyridoxamine 5'-phosphate oxidase family protein [Ilumatobacter nonamiensis]|uniref:pyridoxamine 5'-phosphate oxidase family protein n=1 Tax=Ilumatobacter nonamiensis TaxID=467093 RepID=UPI0003474AC9|nr:pyridoxamine 5'-phosphate oxidase family protein [Ilumatobacter nonamiensis]